MYRYLFLALLILIFNACANVKAPKRMYFSEFLQDSAYISFDERVTKAYNYERFARYAEARDEFLSLYKDFNNEAFLENAFSLSLFENLDKKNELHELAKQYYDKNANLARLGVIFYLQNNESSQAKNLLEKLITWDKNYRNYILLGDIYLQDQNYIQALKNYKLGYKEEQNPDEALALKIVQIQLMLKQESKAKHTLEDFVAENGCTVQICQVLAQIYIQENNLNKLINTHKKLYELTQDKTALEPILRFLIQQKEYKKALELAQFIHFNDEIILFLYEKLGDLDQAKDYALYLYDKTQNKRYLLSGAVFEFENALKKKQINEKVLNSVSLKFEQGIDEKSEAIFLNYYGYLLIDYNKDVIKGIELVQRALEQDSENLFYLDSLAWGYYKQGQCVQAWEIFEKTLQDKEFSDSNEAKEHAKMIKQCMQKGKR